MHTRGRLVNYAQAKFIISSGKTRWVAVNFARAANLSAAERTRTTTESGGPPFLFPPFSFSNRAWRREKVSAFWPMRCYCAEKALLPRSAHECDFLFVPSERAAAVVISSRRPLKFYGFNCGGNGRRISPRSSCAFFGPATTGRCG